MRAPPPSCPEVSISLVTQDRPLFLEHALELIAQQDYPAECIELVLVDSSEPPVQDHLIKWPVYLQIGSRLRYFHVSRHLTIGEKRNFAVRHSRGSIVMQWDDDDYYGRNRIRLQTAPIHAGRARFTALVFGLWYFLDQDEFWHGPPPEMGYGLNGGHPGTLTFDRTVWSDVDSRLQYQHTNFADPDDFQSVAAELLHATTEEVGSEVDFVYVRHQHAAASCEGKLRLGLEECILGIYFEVLGVRGFGSQLDPPLFLPRRTFEFWERIRRSQETSVTLQSSTTFGKNISDRFDQHTSYALELIDKNLTLYSDFDLVRWARGETVTDATRKRREFREVFLCDVLPALLTRVASGPHRFTARALSHATLICHRLGHDGDGLLPCIADALRLRLNELVPKELAFTSRILDALDMTWEAID